MRLLMGEFDRVMVRFLLLRFALTRVVNVGEREREEIKGVFCL